MSRPRQLDFLGNIDIYLLDQILRGRIAPASKVLDAGCGHGRNLQYFLQGNYDVYGADPEPSALAVARELAREWERPHDDEHFRGEALESLSFADSSFDLVICNAVLHFAQDLAHFRLMTESLHRVVAPGGIVFTRLTTDIGLEGLAPDATVPGWCRLPDGSDRFLMSMETLLARTRELGGELADPIKTVNVQHLRCMTNWIWYKP